MSQPEELSRYFSVDRAGETATVVEWVLMPDGSIYIHDVIELPIVEARNGWKAE